MTQYAKTIVAALSALGVIIAQAVTSSTTGWAPAGEDIAVVLCAAIGAFGVWLVPNSPLEKGRHRKLRHAPPFVATMRHNDQ